MTLLDLPRRFRSAMQVLIGGLSPPNNSKRLSEVLDTVQEGVMLWDRDDRLLLWNESFLRLYPSMRQTITKGMSFEQVVYEAGPQLPNHPYDTPEQMTERRYASHRSLPSTMEIRYKDGRCIEINERLTPEGFVIGLYSDVSERYQAQVTLANSEGDLRTVLRLSTAPERSFSDRVVSVLSFVVNRLGLEVGLLLRIDPMEQALVVDEVIAPPNTFSRGERIPLPETLSGSSLGLEYPVTIDDATHAPLSPDAAGYRLEGMLSHIWAQLIVHGNLYGVVSFASRHARALPFSVHEMELVKLIVLWISSELTHVTTEAMQRKLVEATELASRTKGEFIANMSHELRTPLNAIIGFSDVMISGVFGPLGNDKYRDYVQSIYESGQHLLGLINDILDVSKLDAAHTGLAEEEVVVADVCGSTLRIMQERAEHAGVALTSEIAPDFPILWADPRRLKQILLNLLSNAIKFTPAGGSICLTAQRTRAGGLLLRVKDTGIGMRPEDIRVALTAFMQVDNSSTRRHEGTGLGLPLAHSLVELHGGTMTIRSAPNRGTTVSVWLPAERFMTDRPAKQ